MGIRPNSSASLVPGQQAGAQTKDGKPSGKKSDHNVEPPA